MKLHHLRDIVAIAERGGLRAASRHLQIAQPALTRSLSELERELGAPLFERHSRGMALTAMGRAFVPRIVPTKRVAPACNSVSVFSDHRHSCSSSICFSKSATAASQVAPLPIGPSGSRSIHIAQSKERTGLGIRAYSAVIPVSPAHP